MCILQIGELSASLSEGYRTKTSKKIPWSNLKGMRNIVAHDSGPLDEALMYGKPQQKIFRPGRDSVLPS